MVGATDLAMGCERGRSLRSKMLCRKTVAEVDEVLRQGHARFREPGARNVVICRAQLDCLFESLPGDRGPPGKPLGLTQLQQGVRLEPLVVGPISCVPQHIND
jgi:hypothetical protein